MKPSQTGLSRRNALKRLGLAVGAAYAAPVFLTLSEARASGGSGGGSGGASGASGASAVSAVSPPSTPSTPDTAGVAPLIPGLF